MLVKLVRTYLISGLPPQERRNLKSESPSKLVSLHLLHDEPHLLQ